MPKLLFSVVNPLYKKSVGNIEDLPPERVIYGLRDSIYYKLSRECIPNSSGLSHTEMRVYDHTSEEFFPVDLYKDNQELDYTYIIELYAPLDEFRKLLSEILGHICYYRGGDMSESRIRSTISDYLVKDIKDEYIPAHDRIGLRGFLNIGMFVILFEGGAVIPEIPRFCYRFVPFMKITEEEVVQEFLRNELLESGNFKAIKEFLLRKIYSDTKLRNSSQFITKRFSNKQERNECCSCETESWRFFKAKNIRYFGGGTLFDKNICSTLPMGLVKDKDLISNCFCRRQFEDLRRDNLNVRFYSPFKLQEGVRYLSKLPELEVPNQIVPRNPEEPFDPGDNF